MGILRFFASELAELLFRSNNGSLCVLAFYMDDSADKKREKIYVVGGFLGRVEDWFEAERQWEIRVRRDGLDYFRANDCNVLAGEFAKLLVQYGERVAHEMADELMKDLWEIIRSANLFGFCFLGSMPAYKSVRAEPYSEYVFERDPYIQAHQNLIYHVASWVCRKIAPPEPVAFVFDEHSKAASLVSRWGKLKEISPVAARCMGTLAPLDDRGSPAIQMGDLIANTAKRIFEDSMDDPSSALDKLKKSCGKNLAWVAAWDENYLRALREASIDTATAPTLSFEFDTK